MNLPTRPRFAWGAVAALTLVALGCGSDAANGEPAAGACYFLVGPAAACDVSDCVPSEGAASADCSCKPGYFCADTCAKPEDCRLCPDPIAGCGASSTCCRPKGYTGQPDAACLELCHATDLSCFGPDAEGGTGKITASTATGCSGTVTLAVTGSVDWTIDCTLRQVCIDANRSTGCLGKAGACYPVDLQAKSFGYHLRACITGGLGCTAK